MARNCESAYDSSSFQSINFTRTRPEEAEAPMLDAAIQSWSNIVGTERVLASDEELASYRQSTFPWSTRCLAVVRPTNAAQVQDCHRVAAQEQISLLPVSRGRGWGLSGWLQEQDAAVLDLSRLDRILDLDLETGTALIEPGVTFTALQSALSNAGLTYHLPSFGGPTDASVLANALERGEGMGREGDRYAGLFDLEVVLPTGERFSTGYSRFENGGLAKHHARPSGPLLEGLFSQSQFGTVVAGRVTLAKTHAHRSLIVGEIGQLANVPSIIDILRKLVVDELIASHDLAIWDGAKRRASINSARNPSGLTHEKLPEGWGLSLSLSAAHHDLLELRKRLIVTRLREVIGSISIFDDAQAGPHPDPTPLTGFSTGQNIKSCYAGLAPDRLETLEKEGVPISSANSIGLNPARDRCGFIWLCPVVPFIPKAVVEVSSFFLNQAKRHDLFGAIGFQAAHRNALHGYLSLAWDRTDATSDARAIEAVAEIARGLSKAGYHSFRSGVATRDYIPASTDDWDAVAKRISNALGNGASSVSTTSQDKRYRQA